MPRACIASPSARQPSGVMRVSARYTEKPTVPARPRRRAYAAALSERATPGYIPTVGWTDEIGKNGLAPSTQDSGEAALPKSLT